MPDISWYRDLIIIVVGVVAAIALLFRAITEFLLYRRMRAILGSLEAVMKNIECISYEFEESIVKPIQQFMAIFAGIRSGMNAVGRIFGKNKGGENG